MPGPPNSFTEVELRGFLPLVATAVVVLGVACGAPAPPARPAPAAEPTHAEIDPRMAAVDSLFARWDRADSPGCAVGVVEGGELVYAWGYGSANLDHGVPITARSVFYAASVSKQFTAAVLVLLEQQGRLSLDDDVRRYVPELPEYERPITLRQLLHHTSGLRDYLTLMRLAGMRLEDAHSDEAVLDLIARQRRPNFPPGERYLYSNTGYFLVSVIVPRVTGSTLREFADEHLFAPLGMQDTHFHDDPRMIVPGRAVAYSPADDGRGYRLDFWFGFDKVGSGGLLTTVEDLYRWERNFVEPQVGGPALLAALHSPGRLADGTELHYLLGLRRGEYRGAATVGHGGASMGFRSHLLRLPDHDFAAILLCNTAEADTGDLARAIVDIYLGDELGPPPPRTEPQDEPQDAQEAEPLPLSEEALAPYTGEYHSPELRATYRIALEEGGLLLHGPPGESGGLTPVAPHTFRVGPHTLRFRADRDGRPSGFVLDAGRALGIVFERKGAGPGR